MFASRSTNVGSDLPLWAVQADGKPGVSTVHTFMGGWTSAYAKQYKEGESSIKEVHGKTPNLTLHFSMIDTKTPECGGAVDLDSFLA